MPLSNYVFRYDSNFVFMDSIEFKSKKQGDKFEYLIKKGEKFPNNEKFNNLLNNRSSYEWLKYDKFRDVYYRIYLHENPDKSTKLSFFDKTFSLIVMDSNFMVIDEIELSGIEHNLYNYFITENGISFVNNNKKSKTYDKDYLQIINYKTEVRK